MITLLSTIFGVLSSLLPSIVNIFQKKLDYQHDIEITKIQMDAAREGLVLQLQAAAINAEVEEGDSIRRHDMDIEYKGFWGKVRASIRPTITYSFFILFCGIKISAFYVLVQRNATPTELLSLVWDTETMSIFSAIMGFWFGSRAIEKFNDLYSGGSMFSLGSSKGTSAVIVGPASPSAVASSKTTATTIVTSPSKPKRPAGTGTRDK